MKTTPTEQDMLNHAEAAGFLPNTIHAWMPALTRYTEAVIAAHEARLAPVIEAAQEWSSERTPKDWQEGDLMKAIATLNGDWAGCEGCDHQCDEPCMPATVTEIHASIDRHLAKLGAKDAEAADRFQCDSAFADALIDEVGQLFVSGETETARTVLRGLVRPPAQPEDKRFGPIAMVLRDVAELDNAPTDADMEQMLIVSPEQLEMILERHFAQAVQPQQKETHE